MSGAQKNRLTEVPFESAQHIIRVMSGIFGQAAKFGQSPCLFHSSIIGIKK